MVAPSEPTMVRFFAMIVSTDTGAGLVFTAPAMT